MKKSLDQQMLLQAAEFRGMTEKLQTEHNKTVDQLKHTLDIYNHLLIDKLVIEGEHGICPSWEEEIKSMSSVEEVKMSSTVSSVHVCKMLLCPHQHELLIVSLICVASVLAILTCGWCSQKIWLALMNTVVRMWRYFISQSLNRNAPPEE
ncbi:unnamed protein product [Choristocarpus tenellus]